MGRSSTYIYEDSVQAFCARGLCPDLLGRMEGEAPSVSSDWERGVLPAEAEADRVFGAGYKVAMAAYVRERRLWDELAGAVDSDDPKVLDYRDNLPARYEHLLMLRDTVREALPRPANRDSGSV